MFVYCLICIKAQKKQTAIIATSARWARAGTAAKSNKPNTDFTFKGARYGTVCRIIQIPHRHFVPYYHCSHHYDCHLPFLLGEKTGGKRRQINRLPALT